MKTTPPPKVTVLMPVYNGEEFLREAIASILGQTFTDFELLIIDDGSTDRSREIVAGFQDGRIRLVCNETNLGIAATLNRGLALAGGEFVARMDSDDRSHPSRLMKQVEFLDANPMVAACGTWLKTFGKDLAVWRFPLGHDEIKARMLFQNSFPHAPVMLRRDALPADQLQYRPGFPGAEDYDLWVRLMNRFRLANLPEVLYHYRQYDQQVTRERSDLKAASGNRIRRALLEEFGVDMSEDEFQLHCMIALNIRGYSLDAAEAWLVKIARTNRDRHYFEPDALSRVLGRYWLASCARSSRAGLSIWRRFRDSALHGSVSASLAEQLGLFARCALRQ